MLKAKITLTQEQTKKVKQIVALLNELGSVSPWFVALRNGEVHSTIVIDDGINVDVDAKGNILGIEHYGF